MFPQSQRAMESLLKEILHCLLVDCLLTPGKQEQKRLMQLASAGPAPDCDRAVVHVYGLCYGGVLFGSIWGSMQLPGATEPTLLGYSLCYMGGSLLPEALLFLYTLAVKRSEWQVLASCSIRRDGTGRVTRYYSARWCWLLRIWGLVFLVAALLF